jgi:hypothetical protein
MTKKNYIQPAMEVLAVNAAYSICAESTPFEYGGGSPIDAEPV